MDKYKNLKSDAMDFVPNLRKKLGLGESRSVNDPEDEDERKKREQTEQIQKSVENIKKGIR